jgi:hypothetical protein
MSNKGMNFEISPPRVTYNFLAFRAGQLLWEEVFPNAVALVGKNDLLDKYFAGSAYTASWFVGLIDGAGFTVGPQESDTMVSHTGWVGNTNYSQGARPAVTWSAASGKAKSSSAPCTFSITSNINIVGGFLVNDSTKGGTAGILYSAGLFVQGSRSLLSGDVLQVNLTVSVA